MAEEDLGVELVLRDGAGPRGVLREAKGDVEDGEVDGREGRYFGRKVRSGIFLDEKRSGEAAADLERRGPVGVGVVPRHAGAVVRRDVIAIGLFFPRRDVVQDVVLLRRRVDSVQMEIREVGVMELVPHSDVTDVAEAVHEPNLHDLAGHRDDRRTRKRSVVRPRVPRDVTVRHRQHVHDQRHRRTDARQPLEDLTGRQDVVAC
mmetsp:Transcript_1499/g.5151  ORF Transcript_1499/g.5151 Transcript_1499/m.5151 type:complete len:204 (+) Transcript_1499:1533-2144(+)